MQPASKRSTRAGVSLNVGPMSFDVTAFSGIYKPESPKTYCRGPEDKAHEHTELKSKGRSCPVCEAAGATSGVIVQAYKAADGAMVPIAEFSTVDRMLGVEELRDCMNAVATDTATYAESAIESGNIYWLTPAKAKDRVGYLGLVRFLEEEPGVRLVTAWASRSVAKLYRIGVHAGMLTLTELVPEDSLRAAPQDPPEADTKQVASAAQMFKLAATMTMASREEVAELAIDPGREALKRAADAARESGAEELKKKRGERTTFAEKLAELDLEELLGVELFDGVEEG